MIRAHTVPTLADPKLIDFVLLEIQTILGSQLTWLDNAYGKAQKLKNIGTNGEIISYPGIYKGGKEYGSVYPDEHCGNFSFFMVKDGSNLIGSNLKYVKHKTEIGIVFWFDFRSVYPADWEERSVENVKAEVYQVLNDNPFSRSQMKFLREWDESAHIYSGFSGSSYGYNDREIDGQFLMRPYGGFRIDIEIIFNNLQNC